MNKYIIPLVCLAAIALSITITSYNLPGIIEAQAEASITRAAANAVRTDTTLVTVLVAVLVLIALSLVAALVLVLYRRQDTPPVIRFND